MIRLELGPLAADPDLARVWPVLPGARLVGGVVRDLISGGAIADLDLATPEPPETVMRRLADASIRSVATGLSHGTITALAGTRPIEITSLRRDEQTDGRHAVVAWTDDWREDAQRRDFTFNAMSLAPDGALFDYFGGLEDLRAGRVRFVGDAGARIAEDALRTLRFFRFDARYRSSAPDAAAIAAIAASLSALARLSGERVWSELRRILLGPRLAETLALMRELGVLDRLLPGGGDPQRPERVPADTILRLAALIEGPAAPVAAALRLSNSDAARLASLRAGPTPHPGLDDADLRRLLADASADLLAGRAWLAQTAAAEADPGPWNFLRRRLVAAAPVVFPLAGRDLLARGLTPGVGIGQLLDEVRGWWLEGGCVADRDACLQRLDRLIGRPVLST
ncbi:CCA tRNA nucleotidyltransferase [Lichenicoccus sp.]|uniref:CCA tRNA nucleotidyltransferase n=1 Tax=Lichenicoccus sp. TaxID=2781899 RepID=UPI003D133EDB